MSTTHKATPYAREYVPGTDLFLASDYPLSHSLGLEIAEALGERLTTPDTMELDEIIHEMLDSVFPVYSSDILKEWQEAQCPEPVEYDLGPGIWDQMRAGLYESMQIFAYALIGDTETPSETLERLNAIYPYKTTTDAELGAQIVGRKLGQLFN